MSWNFAIHVASFAIIPCRKRTTNVLMRLCRLVCTLVVSKQGIRLSLDNLETTLIGPDKEFLFAWKSNYFLTHWFKLVFWVLKRTVSLRRFFWVPTTYVLDDNKENIFPIRTLIWRPVFILSLQSKYKKDFQSHLPPSCGQGRMIRLDVWPGWPSPSCTQI